MLIVHTFNMRLQSNKTPFHQVSIKCPKLKMTQQLPQQDNYHHHWRLSPSSRLTLRRLITEEYRNTDTDKRVSRIKLFLKKDKRVRRIKLN